MEDVRNKFASWLKTHRISAYEFARTTRIAEPTIYKAVRGEPLRCDTIDKLLRFTAGLKREDFNEIDYSGVDLDRNSTIA